MRRTALVFTIVLFAASAGFGATNPVDDLFKQGQTAAAGRQFDEAVNAYERVVTEHPEAVDRWGAAETGIANALAKKGDLAGAERTAHLCMDAAPNSQSFDMAVALAASIFSAIDGKVDRANQFLDYEQTGEGTNPMDAVGYPSQPEREKALAAMREQAGDTSAGSRLRAFTYLLSGKPHDALPQFADAFHRSSASEDLKRSAMDLVFVGLRDVHGDRAGLAKAMAFVIFGPNGSDGKPHTADDLSDPFAGLIPAPPAPNTGGLTNLGLDDLAALRKVSDAMELYASDRSLRADFRRAAAAALQRTTDALDGWTDDRKQWYLQVARLSGGEAMDDVLYVGAQAAARNRALNFGGTHAMWAEFDQASNVNTPDHGITRARAQFDGLCAALQKLQGTEPAPRMLKKPAVF